MNDVISFISHFTSNSDKNQCIDVFNGQCSYWFAMILFRRFIRVGATIMCDKNKNHFGTRINGRVYDITGDVTSRYSWASWLDMTDDSQKAEIISKYIMF